MIPTRPEHACAILVDAQGLLLLQLRPASARHAANQLACFGGKLEGEESAEQGLRRELAEELSLDRATAEALALHGVVDLWRGPRWIAWFAVAAAPGGILRPEPGFHLIRAPWASVPGLPITPWHRAVLLAWRAGIPRVEG
jgi:8-oxo-dGTP pyrophosphatase MutT (NUDIX family)